MSTASQTLKQKAVHEFKEYLVISLYLWLVFGLLEAHKSVILAEQHLDFALHAVALFNALALAKVVLVAREVRFADQLKDAPLIYPTLLKSVAFSVLLGIFKILEDAGLGTYRGKSFHESTADFGGGTWRGIITLMALVGVLLIPFFGFTELRRVFGEDKLVKLFFSPHRLADSSS